ncbi:pentapeptide repeat-containing protein [Frankia sp. AgPm24]|uniref:pentapeptide repeat-containing protein n=1 Tax=Frankia sp. AgPm24 TaxID=631128 RepID=UPI002551DCBA|nr:pentapeptide repeat-containing protein [Frankia sp. AgPm24]
MGCLTSYGGAKLRYVFFGHASIDEANLRGADLRHALGLIQAQLESAQGDAHTRLPEGLTRPASWSSGGPTGGA